VNYLPTGDTQADGTPCPPPGCLFNRPADRSDQFVLWLPKIGLNWLPTDSQSVYLNLGRGARAPEAAELYELQQGQVTADLNPETLDDYELGWRGDAGGLHWDTDAYSMLKDHFIFRDSNGFNVSDGRTRHRGAELAVSYAFDEHWSLLLDGSYAVQRYAFSAQLAQGNAIQYGNEVKYAPRTLGSLRLRWQPSDTLSAEAQYQHVGGYWLDESNQHRYGGHDLLNLYARRALGGGYTLTAKLLNAADTAYAERADYSFGNYRYFPGDGREWFVGMEKSW
jgi:outer membrane receptor protein involved in Fe transport